MSRFRARDVSALLPLALLAGACGRGPSYGSPNAVIGVVDPAIRERVEPILREAFEREVMTTRPEPIFEVTFTTPEAIGEFRRWRRLIVIEPLSGARLVPELVDVPEGAERVVERLEDEWARGQRIHVLAAATPEATIDLVAARIDSLFQEIHADFVAHQIERMWASGRDSERFHALVEEHGFGVVLPRVYRSAARSAPEASLVWYNEDPRRVVSLHWTARPDSLTADAVLAVRRTWGAGVFPEEEIVGALPGAPADTAAAPDTAAGPAAAAPGIVVTPTTLDGRPAVRLQGVWQDVADVNAGVFVTYGVVCGDRLVLLDGNLFAPDRDKYPYLIQLDRVFATFHCAGGAGT